MSVKVRFTNDVTGAEEETQGSDSRLNVSARSDSRAYYNSRDQHLTFAVPFAITLMDTDENFVAWRNASDDKELVISHLLVSVFEPVDIKWHVGTGTPAAGTVIVPVNLNQGSSRSAPVDGSTSVMMGTTTTPLTGLTSTGVVMHQGILAIQESVQVNFHDEIRLGQNDTFFGELEDASTPGYVRGTIYGYYE